MKQNMNEKREYAKATMQVVQMQGEQAILAGSEMMGVGASRSSYGGAISGSWN